MSKQVWRAGNMLYPLPAVMVSLTDGEGHDNIITIGWTGTICSSPAMLSISIRKERHSHAMLMKTEEFVLNLTTEDLAFATDYCGVKSGRDVDKFKEMKLTKEKGVHVQAPLIGESPVNIECRVTEVKELGSHDMFLAEVLCVHADEAYMDETGRFDLALAKPIVYSHGQYYRMGKCLGKFGYSVKKPVAKKATRKKTEEKKSEDKKGSAKKNSKK